MYLKKLTIIDNYFSKVISFAYKNQRLICNPVITRNPLTSSFLYNAVYEQCENELNKYSVFKKVFIYYFKSFIYFLLFIFHFIVHKNSNHKYNDDIIKKDKSLIVINTYMMIDRIYPNAKFEDKYFGNLYDIMKKMNKQYIVLCFLFGDKLWNFKRRFETYNIIEKDNQNFITEFELLDIYDWIQLIKFIILYPLETLQITNKNFGEFDDYLKKEIVNTLDSIQFINYVRYLVGRKFSLLTNQKIKLIGWYENQVIDKLLFKGIRESGVDFISYGCQFYDKPVLCRNLYPLPEESEYGVLPDIILVSGRYYLNAHPKLNVKLGISPRYNYLFDIDFDKFNLLNRSKYLILLTYDIEESKHIIKLVEKCYATLPQISIKFHPNHLLLKPFQYPKSWEYTENNLSEICLQSSIVISAASGSALEAAVMGCSVIIVENKTNFTLNPMPEYGKGKIWDIVSDADELRRTSGRLAKYRKEHPEEIFALANKYRDMFYTQATEEKYIELFDLDE